MFESGNGRKGKKKGRDGIGPRLGKERENNKVEIKMKKRERQLRTSAMRRDDRFRETRKEKESGYRIVVSNGIACEVQQVLPFS